MIRVVLYVRVSTDMQAEEGLSIPAQLNEMREFAARRGWTIVAEFVDPGHSGSSMERPGLYALLQAIEQGNCDVVLVHELSRLSRSIFDTFRIFEELGQRNIGFASVKDPDFDFSTPTGRLFLTIIAAINQYYLDLLKQHTAKGKRERARQGLYNASIIPHGYQNVGDAKTPPQIEEKEAEAVRLAFETYATGTASYQDVADRLNEAGYRTRKGKLFSKDTIDDMLRNSFYVGDIVYGTKRKGEESEIFPGQHEAIISRDLFEACQRIRRKRRGAARSYQSKFRTYLLNAISVCSVCRRELRAQATKTNRYYREMSKARGYMDCPNAQRGVVADEVESQMEEIFRHLEIPADWQKEVEALLDRESELEVLNSRRSRLKAELRRLREMNLKGQFDDDLEHFDQLYTRVRAELDALPTSDLGAIEEAASTLSQLAQVWDEADMVTKRDLLRLVLSQTEIDVQQKRVVSLTPYAPFLPLFRRSDNLVEIETSQFIPLWLPELAEQVSSDPVLPPLIEPPTSPQSTISWPEVVSLPSPAPNQRITPTLSKFLKARRKAGVEVNGKIIEVANGPA
jgi:site-specific DNA recombinase